MKKWDVLCAAARVKEEVYGRARKRDGGGSGGFWIAFEQFPVGFHRGG